jgi:hypothetical protein
MTKFELRKLGWLHKCTILMDVVLTMLMLLWNLSIRKSERSTRRALALSKRAVGLIVQQFEIVDN